jgi:hypothetical protein
VPTKHDFEPITLLPEVLRQANPLGVPRLTDGV